MLNNTNLSYDVLKELELVTSEYYLNESKKIIINPLSAQKISDQLNTPIVNIRTMKYDGNEVTGLEAIVKAFSKELIYHLNDNLELNDLSDVEIEDERNGDTLVLINGVWKNKHVYNNVEEIEDITTSATSASNVIPEHNHGTGITNYIVRFIDGITGKIGISKLIEENEYFRTDIGFRIGGSLRVKNIQHMTELSNRILVQADNGDILYKTIDEIITDVVIQDHNHDDLYYRKTQLQNSGQSNVHWGNLTNIPSSFTPSNHNSTHLPNGTDSVYPSNTEGYLMNDGSGNLSWSSISIVGDYAPTIHQHSASDITSGLLPVSRGGTGIGNLNAGYVKSNGTNAFTSIASIPWSDLSNIPSSFTPSNHNLISSHTVSGLTTGHFLKALSSTTFGFVAHGLTYSDVGAASADHVHDIADVTSLQTALDGKQSTISVGTTGQFYAWDKTMKAVDWTYVANKPSSFTPSAHSHLWSEITDKPSTFTPSLHVHAIADITSLQTTLDGKQPVHANLTSISNLSTTPSGRFLVTNGSAIVARSLQNSDLPAIAITDTFVVSSQAAMLALSAAERGDVAVRTDLNKSFILKGDNPASLSDWQELLTPTDAVLSVDGRTGVVSLSDKYQPLDTDLTAIAALTHSNRHVLISDGSTWTRRALVAEDIPNLSATKITSGTLDNAYLSFNPDYFVQGNLSTRTTNTGNTDVDSYSQSGFYRAARAAPHLPTVAGYGIIHTNYTSDLHAFQLASQWDSNELFYRTKSDGIWRPWVELYHSGNLNPADFSLTTHNHDALYAALSHNHSIADVTNLQTALDGKVPTSRTITAGTGLSGGGSLSANRTINVSFGSTAGTVCQGNDPRLSDARTPINNDYYVQGSSSARTTNMGSTDINLISQSGFYRSSSSAPNLPSASTFGIIHTQNTANTNAVQLASRLTANRLYYRTKSEDTWKPWVELWHKGNFDPNDYAPAAHAASHLYGGGDAITGEASFGIRSVSTSDVWSVGGGLMYGGIGIISNTGTYRQAITFTDTGANGTNVLSVITSIDAGATWTNVFNVSHSGTVKCNDTVIIDNPTARHHLQLKRANYSTYNLYPSSYEGSSGGRALRINVDSTSMFSFGDSGDLWVKRHLEVGGDLIVGATNSTSDKVVRVLAGNNYNAGFEAYGGASQGTGYLFVGQSSTTGGGIFYNGDGNPTFATGETKDRVSFYRRTNGANHVVFEYPNSSNNVSFFGNITSPNIQVGTGNDGVSTIQMGNHHNAIRATYSNPIGIGATTEFEYGYSPVDYVVSHKFYAKNPISPKIVALEIQGSGIFLNAPVNLSAGLIMEPTSHAISTTPLVVTKPHYFLTGPSTYSTDMPLSTSGAQVGQIVVFTRGPGGYMSEWKINGKSFPYGTAKIFVFNSEGEWVPVE